MSANNFGLLPAEASGGERSRRSTVTIPSELSEIGALLQFSARLGRDPLLVQASSGNTSLKLDGSLWIKASGTWLANAEQQQILVPVRLSECLKCLREGRELAAGDADSFARSLRPSIETFMHAVLPHRVTVHVHSISTLAWAVRRDAPARLSDRLRGLDWAWIPYVPSGLPLAREVQRVCVTRPHTNVFILGNHGLVICGESCSAANSLLCEVEKRLNSTPRPVAKPGFRLLRQIRDLSCWELPGAQGLHALGTNANCRSIAKRGILYPCQAIFLGEALTCLTPSANARELIHQINELDTSAPFVIVEGSGVLLNRTITPAQHAVLAGFSEVLQRIELAAPIAYLSGCEVSDLLNEDAHRYRLAAENSAHC